MKTQILFYKKNHILFLQTLVAKEIFLMKISVQYSVYFRKSAFFMLRACLKNGDSSIMLLKVIIPRLLISAESIFDLINMREIKRNDRTYF